MSEVVSALRGKSFEGYVTVADAGPRGMITLRGDLASDALQKTATGVTGAGFPGVRQEKFKGDSGICWMSPDEVLILCPYADVPGAVARLETALAGTHHLIANVSDARALITVTGSEAREAMAKLTPTDLSPTAFGPGQFRRTRLAQVPAAFWMPDQTTFQVVCFRSVARYVFDALAMSARPGSEVAFF